MDTIMNFIISLFTKAKSFLRKLFSKKVVHKPTAPRRKAPEPVCEPNIITVILDDVDPIRPSINHIECVKQLFRAMRERAAYLRERPAYA